MGKSSSSSKKLKHSTDSSDKLRSVKNKKKTKRNKSKKIRRVKDYSDESESSGSDSSLYSSSSEDDYRRKKKHRSKSSKKRSRKRYSSSESDDDDDDDDSGLLKKKKRSKRKDESMGKKKKKKRLVSRKRRKRELSSSSTSSEQSDDGSESGGKRRSRDRGRLGKIKDVRRRSRDESEGESEPDEYWQVEDEVIPENNSRRLKSIIVVSYGYGNDERKEEDDRDVYMTLSGNRELVHSEESDERDGETTVSYAITRADDNGGKTVGYDEYIEFNKSETSEVPHRDNSMKDDDLEAILKKRALENLKKFRGVTQKSGMARKDVSSVSEEPLQIESEKVEESQDHGLMEQKFCVSAGSKDLETSEKILHVVNDKESGTVLSNSASQQDQQPGDTSKVKASSSISSCSTKRKLIRPLLGKESLNLASRKEAAGGQDAEAESINGSTIDKHCPESSLALAPKNGGENIEPTKVSSTLNAQSSSHTDTETLDETKGGSQSEQKKNDETKDESQYEQKTMTVMRGGEMVQVSYKVYIPKKTSTLGRRKLNR